MCVEAEHFTKNGVTVLYHLWQGCGVGPKAILMAGAKDV